VISTKSKCIAVSSNLVSLLRETHMPYGITRCYLPPIRGEIPPLAPAKASTRFSHHGGMQGWVDLCYMKADRLLIEFRTCQSQVQFPTTEPPRKWDGRFYATCTNSWGKGCWLFDTEATDDSTHLGFRLVPKSLEIHFFSPWKELKSDIDAEKSWKILHLYFCGFSEKPSHWSSIFAM